MKKRILSLVMALVLAVGLLPVGAMATESTENTNATSVTVDFTAQADGAFLCAPQFGVEVSSDLAERYGYADKVTDGVSALDVLVKAHEMVYGNHFNLESKDTYLVIADSGFASTAFCDNSGNNGFILNGMYPHDGTESQYGGYNGTTVATQAVTTGDMLEFFLYQDSNYYSDEVAWFCQNGNVINSLTIRPGTTVTLTLKSFIYMMGYSYRDIEAMHNAGSAVEAAQLAWVDVTNGAVTDIPDAATSENGSVSLTMPSQEGTYYLTAYIPEKEINENYASPLVMSLLCVTVDADAPELDTPTGSCDLTALSVADLNSNPNSLTLKPAFSSDVTSYSVDMVGFQQQAKMAYVKATAASDTATITAELNGTTVAVTSGNAYWATFNNMLPGQNNDLTITVTNGEDSKTYTVTIPMASDPKIPHLKGDASTTATLVLGNAYTLDLSTVFEDADTNTLNYTVKINDADAVAANKDYTFQPTETGTYTLTFTASDGTNTSPSYTVTLKTVTAAENVMHNVAAKYAQSGIADDGNYPWLAAEMTVYAQLFPDTESKLTQAQIQTTLDKLIANASTTTKPGDLSKDIIALRALGYDARKVVTETNVELDVVKKLTDMVDAKSGSVSNYYTLPYVIIALQQGTDYATQAQMDWLLQTAVETKNNWQNTQWGPDGATPMVLALAPYYDSNEQVKTAVDKALTAIVGTQQDNGSLNNSAASTGLGMAAYAALGQTGPVKNSKTLTDGLLTYVTAALDGFEPTNNSFSTEQGFRGLVAAAKNGRIFDFDEMPMETARATLTAGCPVEFHVVPDSATVEVKKGEEVQAPTSGAKYYLTAGDYTYTVSKSGYLSETGSFTVSADDAEKHTAKTIPVSLAVQPAPEAKDISVHVKVLTHDENACEGKYTYKYNSSTYSTELAEETVTLKAGQTVFEALQKTLAADNVTYSEKSFGYIDSIGGISEFDHDSANSGWMYMVNGSVAKVGCRDKVLKSDSTVIWFFTDDYTKEYGSESWGNSGTVTPAPSTPASSLTPEVSANSKGEATVKVDANAVEDSLAQAEKENASALVIAPKVTGQADTVTTQLPLSAAETISQDSDLDLTVQTEDAAVTIPNEALGSIVTQSSGSQTIEVVVKTCDPNTLKDQAAGLDLENAAAVEVTIRSGGSPITTFGGQTLAIDLPVDKTVYTEGAQYKVLVLSADGTVETLTGQCIREQGRLVVRVFTSHLSTFLVTTQTVLPFTDVDGHWALDAIRFVYDQGLMTGTKETQFSPKKPLNRAMLATILYRMEGSPAVTGENPYTDVAAGTWYTDAVLWASEQGIVNGYGNGKFGPLNNITREQLAAMLLRYSDYKKYNTDAQNDLASYADADDISAWALEALRWANAQGLVTGRTETTLVPQGDTTRAETATILMRYLDTIAG
ncbi:S-layer homology domain-containing protein [Evtepia sp.]|uniref:S-layer homology domain-containing protein n=1 Tax=Evtepia sp. TaxID=2773933 RepID=UPI003F14BC60